VAGFAAHTRIAPEPTVNADFMGRLFRITRLALIAYAIFQLSLVVLGGLLFPDYAARHVQEFQPNAFWTAAETQAALAELSWPPTTLPLLLAAVALISTLIGMGFGLFLLWRKSDDWYGLFLTFSFLVVNLDFTLMAPVLERVPALTGLLDLLGMTSWQFMFMVFYLFPDGRFVPRWTRWMPFVWLVINLPSWFFSQSLMSAPGLGLWVGIGLVFTAIGSQVYRYARRSSPIQRQQIKWVVAVLVGAFVSIFLVGPITFRPPPPEALGRTLQQAVFFGVVFRAIFILVPSAIIIAILRYRLWDIDVILRRTLIYSVLTALLALAYFGSVLVLQPVLTRLTGQGTALANVLSTLVIAALFVPLRSRVQRAIDRRLFRSKYDAARTLAGFAAAARDEVDLDRLSAQLVDVVRGSMQPEQVSLWLRPNPPAIVSRPAAFGTEKL
jgi:hypothetical protein